jgi:hypothetical protein
MPSTDSFSLNLKSIDWVVIIEEQKDFLTNGDIMLKLPQLWSQHDYLPFYILIYFLTSNLDSSIN